MTTLTFGDLSFELRHSTKRRTVGISIERDGQLILAAPPEVPIETLEKIVREIFIAWYRDRLRLLLDTQLATLVKQVGASPRSVQVRELGNRWGSCGHKGDLYFHWRVGMLPPVMIEYLVVHELVHLIEPHHTNAFWDRVERILSDWGDRQLWLAQNGAIYNLYC